MENPKNHEEKKTKKNTKNRILFILGRMPICARLLAPCLANLALIVLAVVCRVNARVVFRTKQNE